MAKDFITQLAQVLYDASKQGISHPRLGMREATWEELGDTQERYKYQVRAVLTAVREMQFSHIFNDVEEIESGVAEDRKRRDKNDILLDPVYHPVGTRFLSARDNTFSSSLLTEETIAEWSPSKRRVKLKHASGMKTWTNCWDYDPIVIEVLSPHQVISQREFSLIEQPDPNPRLDAATDEDAARRILSLLFPQEYTSRWIVDVDERAITFCKDDHEKGDACINREFPIKQLTKTESMLYHALVGAVQVINGTLYDTVLSTEATAKINQAKTVLQFLFQTE